MLNVFLKIMARGQKLSDIEKGQIIVYKRDGKTNRQIAGLLGRSPTLIDNYVNDPVGYGTRKSTGRPSKVSERDKRRICREASNSVKSCSTIKKELGLNVSAETIRRTINKNPNIKRRRLKKAPAIRTVNKLKRVDFARQNTRRDWSKVSHFEEVFGYSQMCFLGSVE